MEEQTTTLEFKSLGYDEAYTRYLENSLKHRTHMMWWAWIGWVVMAIAYVYK